MNHRPAQIISSRIEFGKFTPEPEPEPLPEDYHDVLCGASAVACAMVPVGPDGDGYNEDLVEERQRVLNGLLKMKDYLHVDPAASAEEIMALMETPHYRKWYWELKNPPRATFEVAEQMWEEYKDENQMWEEYDDFDR